MNWFVWVKELETIKDGDDHIVLCHYPIAHWRSADYGYVHLYGHRQIKEIRGASDFLY